MKRQYTFWAALVVLLIALSTAVLFFVNYKNAHTRLTDQEVVRDLGEQKERMGTMTANDNARLNSIHERAANSGTISDQDFNWVIALLQSKPIKDTEYNRTVKPSSVMMYMGGLKNLSPTQQQKLYNALHPYLTEPTTQESHSLKLMAIRIVGQAKVASAKPILTQLSQDADEDVRRRAKRALQDMSSS